MEYEFKTYRTFNFKTTKAEPFPSSSPRIQINLKFSYQNTLSRRILNHDSTVVYFAGQHTLPSIDYLVHVDLLKILSYDETCKEIDRKLKSLRISDGERNQLIRFAWNEAVKCIRSKCVAGYATLDLDFQLVIEQRRVYRLTRESEHFIFDSLVLRTLKKHDIDFGKITEICCSICLEDLSEEAGRDSMGLPCLHVFHGDCIDEWLRTTSSCPLCRFQLPASFKEFMNMLFSEHL